MIHTHAKLAPLDFVNKRMIGKYSFFLPKLNTPFIFQVKVKNVHDRPAIMVYEVKFWHQNVASVQSS